VPKLSSIPHRMLLAEYQEKLVIAFVGSSESSQDGAVVLFCLRHPHVTGKSETPYTSQESLKKRLKS
jgi:hypothetical protein